MGKTSADLAALLAEPQKSVQLAGVSSSTRKIFHNKKCHPALPLLQQHRGCGEKATAQRSGGRHRARSGSSSPRSRDPCPAQLLSGPPGLSIRTSFSLAHPPPHRATPKVLSPASHGSSQQHHTALTTPPQGCPRPQALRRSHQTPTDGIRCPLTAREEY